jgi:hypothetical protein
MLVISLLAESPRSEDRSPKSEDSYKLTPPSSVFGLPYSRLINKSKFTYIRKPEQYSLITIYNPVQITIFDKALTWTGRIVTCNY